MPSSSAATSITRSSICVASGTSGAAIRGRRRRVRHDGDGVEADLREVVHALAHHLGEHRQERTDARIRAGLGDDVDVEPDERAVGVEFRCLVFITIPRPWTIDTMFSLRLSGPLDRPPERSGELADEDVLGVEAGLGAEAAADHRRRDAKAAGLHAELGGERIADGDRVLTRDPHRQLSVGARDRDAAVGLHRHAGQPLADRAAFRTRGLRPRADRRLRGRSRSRTRRSTRAPRTAAARPSTAAASGSMIAGSGSMSTTDSLAGVDGLRQRLGDDDRHDVADEADLALGQRRTSGGGRHQRERSERCQLERVGRVGGDHAWHRRGRADIDRVERSVGERRSDEVRVREAVDGHVVVVLVGPVSSDGSSRRSTA